MVNGRLMVIMIFCLLPWAIQAAPLVDASINAETAYAHYPLTGIVTITHQKEETIDPSSFTLEDKKLEVSLEKEVLMSASSDTLVSIYDFELPAKDKGLYVLPQISVKIEGQTYDSIPSSYEVKGEIPPPTSSTLPASTTAPLIFQLEATVKGPTTLYPGEKTTLFYRISFNRSIDLTRSILPMIHPAHFQKIGDVHISDHQEGDLTMQDLSQEVEASEIGTFPLGPSLIEGYAYTMRGIKKNYATTLLQAKAPAITLTVQPFPSAGQPPSFSGAIGTIQVEASLISSPTVSVGDTIQLEVKAQGVQNLAELRFPLLPCQPGFSGFFQTSDLPPLSEVKEDRKLFYVELRPATSLIQEIPAIEFSSYDPATGHYVIQKTTPLPITVQAHPVKQPSSLSAPLLRPLPKAEKWPHPVVSPLEFQIKPIALGMLKKSAIGIGTLFWLIALAICLLALQKLAIEFLKRRPRPTKPTSVKYLEQALKLNLRKHPQALSLIEKAIWERLWENGILKPKDFSLTALREQEPLKPIGNFLYELQALQFSPHKSFDPHQIKSTAQQLFMLLR